jgi:hypothetical protein
VKLKILGFKQYHPKNREIESCCFLVGGHLLSTDDSVLADVGISEIHAFDIENYA